MNTVTLSVNKTWLALGAGLVVGMLCSSFVVQAATTISTNINTGGTLTVSGAAAASSTLQVTGAVTTYGDVTLGDAVSDSVTANAYFTQLRIGTGSTFGWIGTVGADELGVEGDIEVDGTAYFDGTARFSGLASTSALKVGDEPSAPTINGMVFGFCSFSDASITASTTSYVDCTTNPTGALLTTDRIFVQATSSWDTSFVIVAASSTGVSTVNLRVFNTGIGTADNTLNGTSINFWALR